MNEQQPHGEGRQDPRDPTSLPLFTAPSASRERPGRVRSTFSLKEDNTADSNRFGPSRIHSLGAPGTARDSALVQEQVTGPGQGIDWGLVAAFRSQASEQLSAAVGQGGVSGIEEQRALGQAIIVELLQSEAAEAMSAGRASFSMVQQEQMAAAIFDALFGLGRLQPLVDDESVENIEIYGCDNVLLEHSDGTLTEGPAVAESDEELVEFLTFLGSRSGTGRPFSQAQPRLHMRLEGGARLAATAWVTPSPAACLLDTSDSADDRTRV